MDINQIIPKLDLLTQTKADIKTAIESKTSTTLSEEFSTYADAINSITPITEFEPYSNLITTTTTVTIPSTGIYRITAIGQGSNGRSYNAGSGVTETTVTVQGRAGGGGYIEQTFTQGEQLSIIVTESSTTVNYNNALFIRATAGGTRNAGSCSFGSGFNGVSFPSNGTNTVSITPPEVYNDPKYISLGGQGGAIIKNSSSGNGSSGGNGLFGGAGGVGGTGACWTYNSSTSVAAGGVGTPGFSGGEGAGDGGAGSGGNDYFDSTNRPYALAGGGGGAGLGGGGGAPQAYGYYYRFYRYTVSGYGQGGSGGVFIERIQ